ncbi:GntR family transcriptional regulator [[Bacillus] enclensis]|jgi:GntR family transcriptional regulator|uniref:DNA-binding transcriptional regulator YhcF, GntR family n=2 Tax=Rossellomorea TaxID=2837508 RepID=A0A0V8HME0_9BACI|nr:GntR family transcriptional regulator [[Bacillus] enclensis]QTC43623.1 GntR family transcriptional regulator [Bacillus sp. V3]QWC21799.1 GntR family transcriptional regulator [Bacillus haikouensis]KSU63817.1 GntR family transcriptional regulator [[Bacillus] enclensis]MBH9967145.1 GntR family transcriptional regulator [[Bacillus] enclensis]SCB90254.1 DNA-binding transcriptional regulator YhcF, GntR family [[Bacillus] enclensis]
MTEEYTASKPIYVQIADRIIREIVRKELHPGDKLPSVREMAIQSGVNPNTIQRTYSELERMDIVETRRGQGTFVTENEEILSVLNEKVQKEVVEQFIRNMKELGLSQKQMIESLEKYGEGE